MVNRIWAGRLWTCGSIPDKGKKFCLFLKHPDRLWNYPASCLMFTAGSFPGVKNGLGVKLTSHLLMPRSSMSGFVFISVPPLPTWLYGMLGTTKDYKLEKMWKEVVVAKYTALIRHYFWTEQKNKIPSQCGWYIGRGSKRRTSLIQVRSATVWSNMLDVVPCSLVVVTNIADERVAYTSG